jgi:hypothetical protein
MSKPQGSTVIAAVVFAAASILYLSIDQKNTAPVPSPATVAPSTASTARATTAP